MRKSESVLADFASASVRFSQNREQLGRKPRPSCRSAADSKQRSNLAAENHIFQQKNLKIAYNFNLLHFF
jgi:hypothetical protein